ncbi:hypothetical protein [Methylocucumis oryzae]|uniref:ABM domain-containing protein n=1 Tax=Methylocucumis oryzae TaxID=1632867 RepID=A0A0F3IFF7_9GAMM|nr:hypothetical protein [Methylocucumis oryzae]KJV05496.1 hypothetical protein VZ94_17765 [Methylocucumis oryzae]
MNLDIAKLKSIEETASKEMGKFSFFALFLPEDSPNKWDLIVSADWIDHDKLKALRYLAKKMNESFSSAEIVNLSKVVPIETKNSELIQLTKQYRTEHDTKEIRNKDFFGIPIDQAYIITAK